MKSKLQVAIIAASLFAPRFGCAQLNITATSAPAASATVLQKASNSATNPLPRDAKWVERHEGFVKIAKAGGIDLLFLGDSITDNWRNRGSNVWNKSYASRRAANFGIGGDRTQHLLWRIENGELDGIHPKVTVLMIGTNNSKTDSPDDITTTIKLIIGTIKTKCPDTKILLLAIFPRGPHKNSDGTFEDGVKRMQTIHQVNDNIAKLDDGKTVKYLDIGAKFLGADGKIPEDIMPDQLHPSEKGYQIWANAIEPTLVEMLK